MSRANHTATTNFAEVFSTSETESQQKRSINNDNRMMIYFQGMKLHIPDEFQEMELLKVLRVMKKL